MTLEVQALGQLSEVSPEQWNAVAPKDNPFLQYHFLNGLEVSGCVGTPQSGWIPRHIIARQDGQLVGALPLYEKYDSYGEYIFDWSWARAATQAGIDYYPKLVSAVPFTPASGPRLLVGPGQHQEHVQSALLSGLAAVYEQTDASSIHILFHQEDEQSAFQKVGLAPRLSHQFHWLKRDEWTSFEDYLSSMRSNKRKQVRKERRQAQGHGLNLQMLPGNELSHEQWHALYHFYRRTCHFKGAIPYLNESFFNYIRDNMASSVMVSMATQEETTVAGSLFFRGGENLFGRYWGCLDDYKQLHFELCYYLPIEWSFQNGISRIEAGAQGQHKIARGFDASYCHSSHHMKHGGFWEAIQRFLKDESEGVKQEVAYYRSHSSFKE